ncbi:hypothetical protein CBL_03081 [Carabus blaptoides fortunei]
MFRKSFKSIFILLKQIFQWLFQSGVVLVDKFINEHNPPGTVLVLPGRQNAARSCCPRFVVPLSVATKYSPKRTALGLPPTLASTIATRILVHQHHTPTTPTPNRKSTIHADRSAIDLFVRNGIRTNDTTSRMFSKELKERPQWQGHKSYIVAWYSWLQETVETENTSLRLSRGRWDVSRFESRLSRAQVDR